jgi:hypothetical protein
MQSISASLIALVLMWRPRMSRLNINMDRIEYAVQQRERKSTVSVVSENHFPSNQTGVGDSLHEDSFVGSPGNLV